MQKHTKSLKEILLVKKKYNQISWVRKLRAHSIKGYSIGGDELIRAFIRQIPLISACREVVEIQKGFSTDEKYLIHMPGDNRKFLLNVFNLKEWESKEEEYSLLGKMQNFHVTCSRPVEIGKVENRGYMITSYLEGADAEDEISKYSSQVQYTIGYEAGQELKKMHQLSAPVHMLSWKSRKLEKHTKYINTYLSCGTKIKNDHQLMNFIDENSHLMDSRPNVFQHDDFHLGNIIIKDSKFAGVIDFNRHDWGDPIHEFLKVGIFSSEVSIPFSVGQIKGYFSNEEPDDEFWRLYSLYLAMSVFSSVVWTLKTIPDSMDEMLAKIDRVIEDHDYFTRIKPKWYDY